MHASAQRLEQSARLAVQAHGLLLNRTIRMPVMRARSAPVQHGADMAPPWFRMVTLLTRRPVARCHGPRSSPISPVDPGIVTKPTNRLTPWAMLQSHQYQR